MSALGDRLRGRLRELPDVQSPVRAARRLGLSEAADMADEHEEAVLQASSIGRGPHAVAVLQYVSYEFAADPTKREHPMTALHQLLDAAQEGS